MSSSAVYPKSSSLTASPCGAYVAFHGAVFKLLRRSEPGHLTALRGLQVFRSDLAFSADSQLFAVCDGVSRIRVLETSTLCTRHEFRHGDSVRQPVKVRFSPCGGQIVAAMSNGDVDLVSLDDGKIKRLLSGCAELTRELDADRTGSVWGLLTLSFSGIDAVPSAPRLRVWAWPDAANAQELPLPEGASVEGVQIAPDGARLAIEVRQPPLRLAEVWLMKATGEVISRVGLNTLQPTRLRWSDDGVYLFCVENGHFLVLDGADLRRLASVEDHLGEDVCLPVGGSHLFVSSPHMTRALPIDEVLKGRHAPSHDLVRSQAAQVTQLAQSRSAAAADSQMESKIADTNFSSSGDVAVLGESTLPPLMGMPLSDADLLSVRAEAERMLAQLGLDGSQQGERIIEALAARKPSRSRSKSSAPSEGTPDDLHREAALLGITLSNRLGWSIWRLDTVAVDRVSLPGPLLAVVSPDTRHVILLQAFLKRHLGRRKASNSALTINMLLTGALPPTSATEPRVFLP